MSVSFSKNNNNVYQIISYCAPLAGGCFGVALYLLTKIALNAVTNGSVDLIDIINLAFFLLLANHGLPRQLIVNNNERTFIFIRYTLLRRHAVKASKSIITDIKVDNKDGSPNTGLLCVKDKQLYVFNLWGYLLSPKKHYEALSAIKKIW